MNEYLALYVKHMIKNIRIKFLLFFIFFYFIIFHCFIIFIIIFYMHFIIILNLNTSRFNFFLNMLLDMLLFPLLL